MNYLNHDELAETAVETPSERLGIGLIGGAAAGAVLALIVTPAPGMILAASAISSLLGGFVTRALAGRN